MARRNPAHRDEDGPVDVDVVAVFGALGDATRCAVVERLCVGPATVSQLAAPFDMALPSFLQHLGVLERAGIVTTHKVGRTRSAQIDPVTLAATRDWFAALGNHWERRLDQLDALLLATDGDRTADFNAGPTADPTIPSTQETP